MMYNRRDSGGGKLEAFHFPITFEPITSMANTSRATTQTPAHLHQEHGCVLDGPRELMLQGFVGISVYKSEAGRC